MSRPRDLIVVVLSLGLLVSGCGGSTFTRDDAVVALQDAGATAVEAGCMADTLRAVGSLESAQPGRATTSESRGALLHARERCAQDTIGDIQATVAGANVNRSETLASAAPSQSPSIEATVSATESGVGEPAPVDPVADDAIQHLVALGRSRTWAGCVVDQLLLLDAIEVLESPTLGLGASPEEATAIVLCS